MFATQEGKPVPQVIFHTRQGDRWVDVTTDELFKDKTVIVFSLPGAYAYLFIKPSAALQRALQRVRAAWR